MAWGPFRLVAVAAGLAAAPARGLRLSGAGAGDNVDPLVFFNRVDIQDIDISGGNASDQVSAWIREVGTANVSFEFRPSLRILGQGWRLAIPMAPALKRELGTEDCPSFPNNSGSVHMSVTGAGHLCMSGFGFQTRAASTMAMVQEAAAVLRKSRKVLSAFGEKVICIRDNCPCTADFGYSFRYWDKKCGRPVPDFTLWKWPEAGILPDFETVSKSIEEIGQREAELNVCGWVGNKGSHGRIWNAFENATMDTSLYDVFAPGLSRRSRKRMSMEEQAAKWACMFDVPAQGYSGRVPMLLHSNRPLLMVERLGDGGRRSGRYVDHTWYSDLLRAGEHFIPVLADFSDLAAATSRALSPEGRKVAARALQLAREKLTTKKAVEYLADVIASIRVR